jgi:hypothetical protein
MVLNFCCFQFTKIFLQVVNLCILIVNINPIESYDYNSYNNKYNNKYNIKVYINKFFMPSQNKKPFSNNVNSIS